MPYSHVMPATLDGNNTMENRLLLIRCKHLSGATELTENLDFLTAK